VGNFIFVRPEPQYSRITLLIAPMSSPTIGNTNVVRPFILSSIHRNTRDVILYLSQFAIEQVGVERFYNSILPAKILNCLTSLAGANQ
jgi:hypothetical protein